MDMEIQLRIFYILQIQLDQEEWEVQYISLNAPDTIPNYPMGNQWFDIYPNGIYISDAGPNEVAIIRQGVKKAVKKIELTIKYHINLLRLTIKGLYDNGIFTRWDDDI